jgi:hypothetical protein
MVEALFCATWHMYMYLLPSSPRHSFHCSLHHSLGISKGACIVLIGVQCVHSLCGPLSVGHAGVSLPLDPRDSHRVLGMATYRRDVCGWNGRSHVIEKVKQVSLSLRDEAAVVVVVVVVVS